MLSGFSLSNSRTAWNCFAFSGRVSGITFTDPSELSQSQHPKSGRLSLFSSSADFRDGFSRFRMEVG